MQAATEQPGASRPSGTLTIVFTDAVGSTELGERLGDLRYLDIRAGHVAALRGVVIAQGGRVVKDTGDGIMAVFGSARAGVLAAAEMQHAAAAGELQLKVGIHTGEAMEADGDLHGRAVNVAARIVDAAGADEVLLSTVTRAVVDGAGDLAFDAPREVALKGVEGPQTLHPLRWRSLAAPAASQPEAEPQIVDVAFPPPSLLTPGPFPFVGRAKVVDALWDAWKEVVHGARRVVLLAGEPGVGKTRLASELARRVADDGGSVLAGRCDEDLGVAYLPFVDALRHCCHHTPPELRRAALGRLSGELQRLWPELADAVPGLPSVLDADAETQRYRLYDAVVSWLTTISTARPVLLVIDDLHWATQPTLQLVRHLLRAEDEPRVLICATYRDTDLGRTHPLADALADLRRLPGVHRIAVDGLSAHEVESFVEAAAGHDLDAPARKLAQAVHDRTDGNALFVGETLLHLVESGRVYLDGDRWRYDTDVEHLGVPEGLREVVGRRLSRLGEDANDVLRVAAVAGLDFDERVVAAASGRDVDTVVRSLGAAAENGVLVDAGALRHRFTHAVLRDTLYEELRPSPRIRAHIAVADAIEKVFATRLDPHVADLAHHYAQAAPAGYATQAVTWAIRAAHQAEAGAAHAEASRFYDLALEALEWEPDEIVRADLLVAQGEARLRMNSVEAARDSFEAAAEVARRLGDAERLARAALGAGGGSVRAWWLEAGRIQQWLIELLEEALTALPDEDNEFRAQVMAILGRELAFVPGSRDRREELCAGAVAMARRLGSQLALARTLCFSFLALADRYRPPDRLAIGEEVIALARELGDLELEVQGHYQLLYGVLEHGDLRASKELIEKMDAIAATLAQPFWRWLVVSFRSVILLCEGQYEVAEELIHQAKELADEAGEVTGHQVFWIQMSLVAHWRGNPAGATPPEAAKAMTARWSTTSLAKLMPAYVSFVYSDAPGALAELESVSLNDFGGVPDDAAAGYAFAGTAWLVWSLNVASMARPVYNRLLPRRGTMALPMGPHVAAPQVDMMLAVLSVLDGRLDDAETHLGEAAEWVNRFGVPWYEVALAAVTAELAVAQGAPHAATAVDDALARSQALDEHMFRPLIDRLTKRLAGDPAGQEPILFDTTSAVAPKRGLRQRLRAAVDHRALAVVSRMVTGASDEQLEGRFGSARAQRRIVDGMVRAFRPELRLGFEGEITYELSRGSAGGGSPDVDFWTFTVKGDDASVRPGPGSDPAVMFRCTLADFVRMVAGVVEPLEALFDRTLIIEGDLMVGARVREMFGGVAALGAIEAVET